MLKGAWGKISEPKDLYIFVDRLSWNQQAIFHVNKNNAMLLVVY